MIVSHTCSTTFVNYWTCIDVCKQCDDHCGNSASPFFWTSENFQQMMTSCKIRNSILHHAFWVPRKFHKSLAHYKVFFFLSNSDSDNNHVTTSKHWAEMTDEMTHSTPLKQHHRREPPLCSKKCKLACIYYCQQE